MRFQDYWQIAFDWSKHYKGVTVSGTGWYLGTNRNEVCCAYEIILQTLFYIFSNWLMFHIETDALLPVYEFQLLKWNYPTYTMGIPVLEKAVFILKLIPSVCKWSNMECINLIRVVKQWYVLYVMLFSCNTEKNYGCGTFQIHYIGNCGHNLWWSLNFGYHV